MIYVILVEPENPGNIGAVARAMKNFGFDKLVLINPKNSYDCDEAIARSKHAKNILKKAKLADEDFLDKMDYIVASTARLASDYNIPRIPITPVELSKKMNHDSKIGILFGPESTGLRNHHIQKCDLLVSIPTCGKYTSLNLSHAVSIILYEISKQASKVRKAEIANRDYKNYIMEKLQEVIESLPFNTQTKKETQLKAWKRIFGKAQLTKREAFVVFGFFKKLNEKIKPQNKK